MIHTLLYAALWLLSLLIAFKAGEANEVVRAIRVERLEGREVQTEGGRAHGASRPSSIFEREPQAVDRRLDSAQSTEPPESSRSSIYDQAGDEPQGLYLLLPGEAGE